MSLSAVLQIHVRHKLSHNNGILYHVLTSNDQIDINKISTDYCTANVSCEIGEDFIDQHRSNILTL